MATLTLNESKRNLIVKYLANELTLEQTNDFDKWRNESDVEPLIQEVRNIWEGFNINAFELPENVKDEAYSLLQSRIKKAPTTKLNLKVNKPTISVFFLLKIAAVFIFMLLTSAIIYLYITPGNFTQPISFRTINVNSGTKKQLKLPDNSKVYVNSGSVLTYNSTFENVRMVSLAGEAFINVVPDPQRPFIVNCGDYRVKVIGTSFNIRSYPEDNNFSVFVNEGIVEVSHKKRVLGLVKPGFALEANKQKITYELMKLEALEIPDWRNNKLVFKNTSFQEIKNTLERHYNVKLILENDKLNNCSFAGSFDNRSIDYVLSIISEVGNFKYKIDYEKKEVSIFGKGCEN